MVSEPVPVSPLDDLTVAEDGSFYTIIGAGGDLQEWVDGYGTELEKAGIGKPTEWFTTTGAHVNAYVGDGLNTKPFADDLILLLFPLEGLDVGMLALFKLRWQDRWFDDIVQNMRRW